MRDVTEKTLTDAVLATIADDADPRFREIMTALIRRLHGFAKEVDLTREEWLAAIDFLRRTGEKTTPKRNEFILLSDTLGLSSLVDMISSRGDGRATEVSVLGPFYIEGSPLIANGGDLIRGNAGEPGVVSGRVLSVDGRPIAGAMLDVWQNAANGLYSNEDPDQEDDNLRGRLLTDSDGAYRFTTIRPIPYTVPQDGPVGAMLAAMGRHPWRPAHIHFRVTAAGYRDLITELYPEDDRYIDEDAVFGVRGSLAVPFRRNGSAEDAAKFNISAPFFELTYDFVL
jgi:protocatechuate 3,4-dioxygenase beta subunit